jgi:hypothetical protein
MIMNISTKTNIFTSAKPRNRILTEILIEEIDAKTRQPGKNLAKIQVI